MQTTSPGPVVLTRSGRTKLSKQLLEAAERQRRMAEEAGLQGRAPEHDSYRDLLTQVTRLQALLDRAVSPAVVQDDPTIVELGDVVTLAYDDGSIDRVTLTNPMEATAAEQNVSIGSPMGRALDGRRVGDVVTVLAPSGPYTCRIVKRRRAR